MYKPYYNIPLSLLDRPKQNFFEQILQFLDGKMTEPTAYGWYHLLCLLAVVAACIFVAVKCRALSDKQFDAAIGIVAAVMIAFEIYKQLNFSYDWEQDAWSYSWYAFPFQFCSTPMYVMTAAYFIKNEKVRASLYAYLATYGLFAGTAVMLYPNDVFIETIGINIQTMLHHGLMVVLGVAMYASKRAKPEFKTLLCALPTFAVLAGSALIMNEFYAAFGDPEQTFNMFYISAHYDCTLPVLSLIYPLVPYPVFLALYLVGFTLVGALMTLLAKLVAKLASKIEIKLFPSRKDVNKTKNP